LTKKIQVKHGQKEIPASFSLNFLLQSMVDSSLVKLDNRINRFLKKMLSKIMVYNGRKKAAVKHFCTVGTSI